METRTAYIVSSRSKGNKSKISIKENLKQRCLKILSSTIAPQKSDVFTVFSPQT